MQKADITDTDQGAAIAESKYEQEIAEIRAELESGLAALTKTYARISAHLAELEKAEAHRVAMEELMAKNAATAASKIVRRCFGAACVSCALMLSFCLTPAR